MSKIKYFAYGSNMSEPRLKNRIPNVTNLGIAKLVKYKLAFNKKSIDGSGKANVHEIDNSDDFVQGVIFEIDETDKSILDEEEKGYELKSVAIDGFENVYLYIANESNIDDSLKPYDWYLFHVIFGAVSNNIDSNYIKKITDQQVMECKNLKKYKQGLQKCISIYSNIEVSGEIHEEFKKLQDKLPKV